jgi:DNA topoisomerase-1
VGDLSLNQDAAHAAGLRYVNDGDPGITRRRAGKGFSYKSLDGAPIRDGDELRRLRALAVPPAWTDVWICPSPRGHIQATGRDARGRKQYRYHEEWTRTRGEAKFERTVAFARALPRLRRRVTRDLQRTGLPREKVLAAVVRLLETTLIRVGNEEYARHNRSFGLTTLRRRHADVRGSAVKFTFRGKSGVSHSVGIRDRRLARVVRLCQELPGQRLFEYLDEDGCVQIVSSEDVNGYLRVVMGSDFTAKDFRTWSGTVIAMRALKARVGEPPTNARVKSAVAEVAAELGNTPAVARSGYIHPAVIDAYLDGSLDDMLANRDSKVRRGDAELRADERRALDLVDR